MPPLLGGLRQGEWCLAHEEVRRKLAGESVDVDLGLIPFGGLRALYEALQPCLYKEAQEKISRRNWIRTADVLACYCEGILAKFARYGSVRGWLPSLAGYEPPTA